MSNSVFQSVIIQLKEVSDRIFGVIDAEGCVVSCTDISLLGERWTDVPVKLVKKTPDRKPGMVIYLTNKTIYIHPDENRVNQMRTE